MLCNGGLGGEHTFAQRVPCLYLQNGDIVLPELLDLVLVWRFEWPTEGEKAKRLPAIRSCGLVTRCIILHKVDCLKADGSIDLLNKGVKDTLANRLLKKLALE